MQQAENVVWWRRLPPAVFPVTMGLFGLALAWRRAHDALAVTAAVSDLILGGVTLLFLFAAGGYVAKLAARPSVLLDEIRVLPGRTGVAALSLSAMLLAAGLVPFAPGLATVLLFLALAVHVGLAVLVARLTLRAPPGGRMISPGTHLTFVGFIVAPLSAVPLGLTWLTQLCFLVALVFAGAVYAALIATMLKKGTPPPLRPLIAIHLAPISLFGIAAYGLELPGLAVAFGILAILVLTALVVGSRYLTVSGFSPLWGAFTFPLTAFAALMLLLSDEWSGFRDIGILALVAATLLIPWIAYRVMKLWAKGVLAVKTNAAIA